MSVYDRSLLLSRHGQRSTKWDEDVVTDDKAEKAFSNAGGTSALVGNSALGLSRASADGRCDLVRISKELDAALDQPLYTVFPTCPLQQKTALPLDNSETGRQVTEECTYRETMFKITKVAYGCHRTWNLDSDAFTSADPLKNGTWDKDKVTDKRHEVDQSQLLKTVAKLSQDMRPNGEYVEATREVAQSVTLAVDELKAVSKEPKMKEIWQVKAACEDTQAAVDTSYKYIDKIVDVPWYGCSKEMRDLAKKTTTYSSIHSDLKVFKSIIDKMQKSLSAAEEFFRALKAECKQAVRSCSEAEAACNRKAEEQRSKKKTTQITGGTIAAVGFGVALVGGGAATVAISLLTLGIGAPIAAGVTAAVAGSIGTTAGSAGAGTAIATAVIAGSCDTAAKAFSMAGRKCASVGNSALRLSGAAAHVRRDLVRISKALDAALDQQRYTVTISIYQFQSMIALLLDNSGSAHQVFAECRQILFQETKVACSLHMEPV